MLYFQHTVAIQFGFVRTPKQTNNPKHDVNELQYVHSSGNMFIMIQLNQPIFQVSPVYLSSVKGNFDCFEFIEIHGIIMYFVYPGWLSVVLELHGEQEMENIVHSSSWGR
jgi:hypothetical protein